MLPFELLMRSSSTFRGTRITYFAPMLPWRSDGRTVRMVTTSPDLVTSILRRSSKSCDPAYLTPDTSTFSWSEPAISTEPLKFSTVIRPPDFSGWWQWRAVVDRAEEPKSSISQPTINSSAGANRREVKLRMRHLEATH